MQSRRGRKLKVALVVGLFGIAFWQLGEAAYIHLKAQLAQYLLQQSWQQTLQGERQVKPWPWADMWPVARMRMPKHNIDLIVLAGDSGRTLAFGPGYRFGTAELGAAGNAMISAHRDTHFEFLQRVEQGDTLTMELKDGSLRHYQVVAMDIIDNRHAHLPVTYVQWLLALVT